jgi:hypothetical protein
VFCENVVWWKANDVFQELSKKKPLFLGNIVEMLGIWHLF